MSMFRTRTRLPLGVCILLVGAMAGAGCGSSAKSSAKPSGTSGSSEAPITIGFITSETGVFAGAHLHNEWGAEAAIDAQNARGGIDGHQIKVVVEDDQSSPTDNATASEVLVDDHHVFAVIDMSDIAFGGAKFLTQRGVPVFGAALDGPEWTSDQNMFAIVPATQGPIDGQYYTYTDTANALKILGVTKLAQL